MEHGKKIRVRTAYTTLPCGCILYYEAEDERRRSPKGEIMTSLVSEVLTLIEIRTCYLDHGNLEVQYGAVDPHG